MKENNSESFGIGLIFIFLIVFIALQENSFTRKNEQRNDELYFAWEQTKQTILEMAEENEKIIEELDPEGELEYNHYDRIEDGLKYFDRFLEN